MGLGQQEDCRREAGQRHVDRGWSDLRRGSRTSGGLWKPERKQTRPSGSRSTLRAPGLQDTPSGPAGLPCAAVSHSLWKPVPAARGSSRWTGPVASAPWLSRHAADTCPCSPTGPARTPEQPPPHRGAVGEHWGPRGPCSAPTSTSHTPEGPSSLSPAHPRRRLTGGPGTLLP